MIDALEKKERDKLRLKALRERLTRVTAEKAERKKEREERKRAERKRLRNASPIEEMMMDCYVSAAPEMATLSFAPEMAMNSLSFAPQMERVQDLSMMMEEGCDDAVPTKSVSRKKMKKKQMGMKKKSRGKKKATKSVAVLNQKQAGGKATPATAAAAASPQSEGAIVDTDTAADGGEANADGDATLETKTESAGEDAADDVSDEDVAETADDEDLTTLPGELDAAYLRLDRDGTLRPTTIKVAPGAAWTKTSVDSLLSSPVTSTMDATALGKERSAAFDLLDALSLSGEISVDCAELHVVVAATHRFARTLVDTVIMDNVNPIEKVERSVLIVAATLHRRGDAKAMLLPAHVKRIRDHSPALFSEDALLDDE